MELTDKADPSMEEKAPHPFMEGKVLSVKDGYYVLSYAIPGLGESISLERDCGDYIQVANLKGPIFNLPGYVAAFGGIPDELKIDGGISFVMPCPPFKKDKDLPEDPLARYQVIGNKECLEVYAYGHFMVRAVHKTPQPVRSEFYTSLLAQVS